MTDTAHTPSPSSRSIREGRFRALADAVPVLIWMAAPDRGMDWVSESWLQFTGRTLEQERGWGWVEGLHPDDRDRCLQRYHEACDGREPFEIEYRLRRHDGVHRWMLDRGVACYDDDGTFLGYAGSCVDVDDLKRAESERSKLLGAERQARAETERVAGRLARLQEVTAALAGAITPEDVYRVVIEQAVAATGAEAGVVCTIAGDGAIVLQRAVGYPEELLRRFARVQPDDDVPIAESVRTGQPVLIPSIPAEARFQPFREAARQSRRKAAATLPLLSQGRCVGALGLSFGEEQAFDPSHRAFLTAVAAQAATALERARLLAAEQSSRLALERAHEQLAFLAEASEVVATSLDRDEILERACRLAVPRLASRAAAYVPEGHRLRRAVAVYSDRTEEAELEKALRAMPLAIDSDRPVPRCFRTRRPHRYGPPDVDSLLARNPDLRPLLDRLRVTGGLAVPIVAHDRALGVLVFALHDGRSHSDADMTVALELARRVGTALENAALYEREHTVAESLQRAILPDRLPTVPEIDIAARYLPAGTRLQVGGDWYDAFRLRDGRLGFTIGDVAGHGLRAAASMGQLRNALRAFASGGEDPADVLMQLSRLVADEDDGLFATAAYGVYEPATGLLRWANAGHPPPVHFDAHGARLLEQPAGLLLGVDPDHPYTTDELVLEPGEGILWYTDGLIERRDEPLSEGMRRLTAAVAAVDVHCPEVLCERVLGDVLTEDAREDDVCILAIARPPGDH